MRLLDTCSGEPLEIRPRRLVVAGYTGRDASAVAAHIAELETIGVPPPASVPAFYDLDPGLLTVDPVVETSGDQTSGEVEPVIIRHVGHHYLAVGSDHTDRALERSDIAGSKAACPKPLGREVIPLGPDLARADWDRMSLACRVDGRPYQTGPAASLRHPADLFDRMSAVLGTGAEDLVLFCGTLPLLTGDFVYGTHWHVQVQLSTGSTLSHQYDTKQRNA